MEREGGKSATFSRSYKSFLTREVVWSKSSSSFSFSVAAIHLNFFGRYFFCSVLLLACNQKKRCSSRRLKQQQRNDSSSILVVVVGAPGDERAKFFYCGPPNPLLPFPPHGWGFSAAAAAAAWRGKKACVRKGVEGGVGCIWRRREGHRGRASIF